MSYNRITQGGGGGDMLYYYYYYTNSYPTLHGWQRQAQSKSNLKLIRIKYKKLFNH